MREDVVTRRRKAFAALEDGTATLQQWQLIPDSVIKTLDAVHLVDIEFNGEFRVKCEAPVRKPSIPHIGDVEMTDVPLLTPPEIDPTTMPSSSCALVCTALHTHTSGVCPVEWVANLGVLEYLRYRL